MDEIRKSIEGAQKAQQSKEKQLAAARQAEKIKKEQLRQAQIAENERKLKATGVVELFKELRDSKVLTWSEDYSDLHAHICWNIDKTQVDIQFDHRIEESHQPDTDRGGYYTQTYECHRVISARISENGNLTINDHIMKPKEKLENVVKMEILRLKGLS